MVRSNSQAVATHVAALAPPIESESPITIDQAPDIPSNHATASAVLSPKSEPKVSIFDPAYFRLSSQIDDPTYQALSLFKWSDRQQHGRLAYDTMYKHPAVAAAFDTIISFLKSYRPLFKPSVSDPTEKQRLLADFANEQLRRLGSSGDPRQGYEKVIEWFGQGLKYGFSIAEMGTEHSPWRGQRRIQIRRIVPLPQATLDHGYNPLEEFGQTMASNPDVRYRCFDLDASGRIREVIQFHHAGSTEQVTWSGGELLRLLIYTHGGGEGNPYGQSLFYTAFYPWAALYTIEQMEEAFMDASLPYLTASYKTPDGRPSPALHDQMLEVLKKQDPVLRLLIGPDMTFGSAAASNPSFTTHATAKKAELRRYILNAIFGIPVISGEASNELDARNSISVFFKSILPGLLREVATLLTWQFARRLIDANWSGLNTEDYPTLEFTNTLDNDLRVATPILQQVLPMVASDRLGEMLERTIQGFDRNWIPDSHSSSVSVQRPSPDKQANPASSDSKSNPPIPPSGVEEAPHGNDKATVGQRVSTVV